MYMHTCIAVILIVEALLSVFQMVANGLSSYKAFEITSSHFIFFFFIHNLFSAVVGVIPMLYSIENAKHLRI